MRCSWTRSWSGELPGLSKVGILALQEGTLGISHGSHAFAWLGDGIGMLSGG
jgi:hypothetical protein